MAWNKNICIFNDEMEVNFKLIEKATTCGRGILSFLRITEATATLEGTTNNHQELDCLPACHDLI